MTGKTMRLLRELDVAVAQYVFNWKNINWDLGPPMGEPDDDWNSDFPEKKHRECVPEFTTDMKAAWLVVEQIRNKWMLEVELTTTTKGWMCGMDFRSYETIHESPMVAICFSALAAVKDTERREAEMIKAVYGDTNENNV